MPTDDVNAYLEQANRFPASASAPGPTGRDTSGIKQQVLSMLMQLGEDEVLEIFRTYINQTGGATAPAPTPAVAPATQAAEQPQASSAVLGLGL